MKNLSIILLFLLTVFGLNLGLNAEWWTGYPNTENHCNKYCSSGLCDWDAYLRQYHCPGYMLKEPKTNAK